MPTSIKIISYQGVTPGPHLVILGAVHGNERCGPVAINKLVTELDSGIIKLKRGKVSLVPVCNPKAYDLNQRLFERDLNRYLYPKKKPEFYEDYLAESLCPLLAQADVLLDLHSYQSPGDAFCFVAGKQSSQTELEFSQSLGVSHFVSGWQDAFAMDFKKDDPRESMGTTEYTRSCGGIAATLECGQHGNLTNVAVARRAILGALDFLDLCLQIPETFPPTPGVHCVAMRQVYRKQRAGKLAKQWRHFESVEEREVLARYDDGEEVRSPSSGSIILPDHRPDLKPGAEWFYFATRSALLR